MDGVVKHSTSEGSAFRDNVFLSGNKCIKTSLAKVAGCAALLQ
jgi:hypothetical protein